MLNNYEGFRYKPPHFLQGRHLTHRETILHSQVEMSCLCRMKRGNHEWSIIAHLVQHRPRYLDDPYHLPPTKRRPNCLSKQCDKGVTHG